MANDILASYNGLIGVYFYHNYKFASLVDADTTSALAITLWHAACYLLVAGRVFFPTHLIALGLAKGWPKVKTE